LANKEIAARMEMPESRVKGTLQRLFAKNGVRTRSHLVRVAIDRYPELLYHSTDPGTSTRTRYSIEQAQAWEQAASGR
jgi:predicted ArsR family transcriptional regulator